MCCREEPQVGRGAALEKPERGPGAWRSFGLAAGGVCVVCLVKASWGLPLHTFPPRGEPGWSLPLWVAQKDSWGCLKPGEVSPLRLCRPYPNSSLQLVAFPPGSCWEVVCYC